MTKIAVRVEADHLDKLIRPMRSLAGVVELIWNGLDAEATEVTIRVLENNLNGVDEVAVVDNGHGMSHDEAMEVFGLLGGSWKRSAEKSKNGQRLLHGSEGQGRWRAFSLGSYVRWTTVGVGQGGHERTQITGTRSTPTEFEVDDATAT